MEGGARPGRTEAPRMYRIARNRVAARHLKEPQPSFRTWNSLAGGPTHRAALRRPVEEPEQVELQQQAVI